MKLTLTDALASWRLTHLIVADVFPPIYRARQEIENHFGSDSSLTYLSNCPYCVGVYVGFGVMLARKFAPRWWGPIAEALALAAVAPLIEGVNDLLHKDD